MRIWIVLRRATPDGETFVRAHFDEASPTIATLVESDIPGESLTELSRHEQLQAQATVGAERDLCDHLSDYCRLLSP